MRKLRFDDTQVSKDRFQLLYQGFLFGAPEGGLKGIDVHRRSIRVMDKIEDVSDPALDTSGDEPTPVFYPTGDQIRQLRAEGGEMSLDDAEFQMLKSHFENVSWLPSQSRKVVDCADFLEAAPKE